MTKVTIKSPDIRQLQALLQAHERVKEHSSSGALMAKPFALSWDSPDEIHLEVDYKKED